MKELKLILNKLCNLDGVSGREYAVRDYIMYYLKDIKDIELKTDNLGNVIVKKIGKKRASKLIMLDAHMDEIGVIATFIEDNGFIRFTNVGGIEPDVLISRKVRFNNTIGVIGIKPIHLTEQEEKSKMPSIDELYIDIGAKNKDDALKHISLGDVGVFCGEFEDFGDGLFKSRAVDDRVGVAVLLELLSEDSEYDFYACFSAGEEIGLKAAGVAAANINPEIAIILEGTTAADIASTPDYKKVCILKDGPAISFMDKSSLYDKELYDLAFKQNIPCQAKAYVAGGNNSGSIANAGNGVRVMTISLPTRYIHSASCVGAYIDLENMFKLTKSMINSINEQER